MKRIIGIILFITLSVSNIFSQNEIVFVDGKKLNATEIKIDTLGSVNFTDKNGKAKSVFKYDVFSINENGKEIVLYEPDTTEGSFTVMQMKDFIQGEFDGKNSEAPLCFTGGVVTGFVAPVIFPVLGVSSVYSAIVPAVYDFTVGVKKINDSKIDIVESYSTNQYYIAGYKTSVKKKRINNAILGSVIGLATGLVSSYFIYEFKFD